jgi:hypothetical protein
LIPVPLDLGDKGGECALPVGQKGGRRLRPKAVESAGPVDATIHQASAGGGPPIASFRSSSFQRSSISFSIA